jgi:hypothetical protein
MALQIMEAQLKNKSKVAEKSHQIAQSKIEHDIDRVIFYVDHEEAGLLSVRQLGQVFSLLGVFKHIFNESKRVLNYKEREREAKEESLLIKCWSILNPFGRETIDTNLLTLFLQAVYCPYMTPNLVDTSAILAEVARLQAA